ncbi:hypothetical protein [Streptomyces sp. KLOTTS4A1]|uniref:hypothetical protein n=1 Tax=Streptomyces sp. KLOTTS4A1 TaxID=3390996 RepID=UPI0039F5F229
MEFGVGAFMAKRDVWVEIDGKMFSTDTIKNSDHSEPRCLLIKVLGEREPLMIRKRWPEGMGVTVEEADAYADTTTPRVVTRGLLDAIKACAADGGTQLLTFETNYAQTEAP